MNRLQVIPLTSNTDRLYPSEAYITLNGVQRKAMTDQLTTVSKQNLSHLEGHLMLSDLQRIEQAIKVQLGLA